MTPCRILIVEDERIVAEDIKTTLLSFGFDVAEIVTRGETAVERERILKPDLILMDIHLAGTMNGIEAAGQIHLHSDVPIIYLTAYADDQLLQSAKVTRPYGYILKPYSERELHCAIEIALYSQGINRTLKESEDRFRTLLSSIQSGIVVIDVDTHIILDINQKGLEMIGGTRDSVAGSVCHRFICPAEQGRCPITDLGQAIDDSERILITAGGNQLRIQKSVISSVLNGKRVLIESFIDITPRKNTEDALKTANKKLNLLNSITRHDILNQLTAQFLKIGMTKEKIQDPEVTQLIEQIQHTSENIERQIMFTRDYQDVGIKTPAWHDVGRSVHDAIKNINPGHVAVRVDLAPVEIFADPLLPKVFYNLVDNAMRHGETLTQITFTCEQRNGNNMIICEDNGVGVPRNQKSGIFNREYYKNTGFGLNLSREILAITGITITENGEPGRGARFEMSVPEGAYRFRQ
ncbi:MAG: response regulator [Methanoregula sp.]